MYDIGFDYSESQTGGVFGYFWSKDWYSQTDLGASSLSPKTNYMEMFYIDAHFTDSFPESIYSTLAHEYQHMINFSVKTIAGGISSPVWFNEMCSTNAEDLVLENIGIDPGFGGQYRLNEFVYHYAESGITDWFGSDNALKSYASVFAFGAFLSRTYGGAAFYKALMEVQGTGREAVTRAISATQSIHGYNDSFDDAVLGFAKALVFTDPEEASPVPTLNRTAVSTIGQIEYWLTSMTFHQSSSTTCYPAV